ncbi:hypothetical protein MIND_00571900 [Mycena indigotica]|uniref:Mitochondrial carrier n=1 Tax=Mycena indigotica TaxID=2126181 RepID=A0A8H6SPG5_9AGAR|nr:uncharacterized protein MIND_00571900 [Mycena indigotica]KAF7303433.1 hypothetical protein MIND_00571900 [Mycena indigotica]
MDIDEAIRQGVNSLGWTLLTLGIGMPFLSTLVRYRANYTPTKLQLPEDDQTPPSDAVVSSYFGVMRRVYTVEGWAGLYKGFTPAVLTTLFVSLLHFPATIVVDWLYLYDEDTAPPAYIVVVEELFSFFFVPLLSALLAIPMQIVTFRAIVTQTHPLSLSFTSLLPAILSPAERRRPSLLYLAPGMAMVAFLLAAIAAVIGLPTQYIITSITGTYPYDLLPHIMADAHYKYLFVLIAARILSGLLLVLLVTPLRLARVRLALQVTEPPELESDHAGMPHLIDTPFLEPVVALRSAPAHGDAHHFYPGVVACLRAIAEEEGKHVLWRGWWIVALQALVSPVLPSGWAAPFVSVLW